MKQDRNQALGEMLGDLGMDNALSCADLRGAGDVTVECCIGCHELAVDHDNWLHQGTLIDVDMSIQVCCTVARALVAAGRPIAWLRGGVL